MTRNSVILMLPPIRRVHMAYQRGSTVVCLTALAALLVMGTSSQAFGQQTERSATYRQLHMLFNEWRAFEEAPLLDGLAPDYRAVTNTRRLGSLRQYQERLGAIDTTGWSISEQVDFHLVRAEMNGMLYHLTVLQPFARDPAYYASVRTSESDTPAEEGPTIHGAIRLWRYAIWPRTALDTVTPLSPDDSRRLALQLRTVPPLLQQARTNLAGSTARDLWVGGIRAFEEQSEALGSLLERVGSTHRDLVEAITDAQRATDAFAQWLRDAAPSRTGPSGVGKDQYTWFLRNVLLLPFSWADEVTITKRELARAHASLRLEENRNRGLPELPVANTPEDFAALQEQALPTYLRFMEENQIVTMHPGMARAIRERFQQFSPAETRDFFSQGSHRDPIPLWTHFNHWWDHLRMRTAAHPSPMRRSPLLYNIWMHRAEGMATAMEEWMMHAGLYDQSPRSREIVWIMLIARAARGLGSLYAQSNDLTMAGAGDIHVNWIPRGWMRRDPLLGFEQHLYLRQPGYGPSYVTGGRLMEEVLMERARQLGDQFTIQRVMDEVNGVGMIPPSLIYWELTGDDRMIRELQEGLGPRPPR